MGLAGKTYVKGGKDQPGEPDWRRAVIKGRYEAFETSSPNGEVTRLLFREVDRRIVAVVPASQIGTALHALHVLSPDHHRSRHATQKAVRGGGHTTCACFMQCVAIIRCDRLHSPTRGKKSVVSIHCKVDPPAPSHSLGSSSTPPPSSPGAAHAVTGESVHTLPQDCRR